MVMKRRLVCAAAAIAALAMALMLPAQIASAGSGWSVSSFDSDVTIDASGALQVAERISVDFGAQRKHGIIRVLTVRSSYDGSHDRVLDVSGIAVERNGATEPFSTDTSSDPSELQIRVGDPDRTVSGAQTYRITYTMKGALTARPDHDELYLNATGDGWDVPIERVSATVHAPGGGLRGPAACYQGPSGSHDTCSASTSGDTATYRTTGSLNPGEQMTIVAALTKGAVPAPTPILVSAGGGGGIASVTSPAALPVAGGALLAGGLLLLLLFRTATRHRRAPATRPASTGGAVSSPPDGLRPAQLTFLRRGAGGSADVLATIVDLAQRGYLTLQPVTGGASRARSDYMLTWNGAPAADRPAPYEWDLVTGVFDGQPSTTLAAVGTRWPGLRSRMRRQLAEDAEARGLIGRGAPTARRAFVIGGVLLVVLSFTTAIAALIAGWWPLGLVPAVLGVAAIVAGAVLPVRTRDGDALVTRIDAFTRFLFRAAPDPAAGHMPSAEALVALLPYAMAFGATARWLAAFPGQAAPLAIPGWRRADGGGYAMDQLPYAVVGFAAWQTAPTMSSSGGGSGWSGGSGFSGGDAGGGVGGGGGSSW